MGQTRDSKTTLRPGLSVLELRISTNDGHGVLRATRYIYLIYSTNRLATSLESRTWQAGSVFMLVEAAKLAMKTAMPVSVQAALGVGIRG
jgi:hypothetical protein